MKYSMLSTLHDFAILDVTVMQCIAWVGPGGQGDIEWVTFIYGTDQDNGRRGIQVNIEKQVTLGFFYFCGYSLITIFLSFFIGTTHKWL